MRRLMAVIGLCLGLPACAELPNEAVVHYYLPQADIHVDASETASCGAHGAKTDLKATATVIYSADTERSYSLRFNDFSNQLTGIDMTVGLTSDGRLSGINAVETGQAQVIAKGAVDFSTALDKVAIRPSSPALTQSQSNNATRDNLAQDRGTSARPKPIPPSIVSHPNAKKKEDADCPSLLKRNGGETTVSYNAKVSFPKQVSGTSPYQWHVELTPDPNGKAESDQLIRAKRFRQLDVTLSLIPKAEEPVTFGNQTPLMECQLSAKGGHQPTTYVCLRETADLKLSVQALANGSSEGDREVVPETHFVVPLQTAFAVPLPVPKLFGKGGVKLTLDEAGGIKEIGYTKTSGTAEVLEAGAAAAGIAAVAATR